jgi:hypothetical protein
MLHQFILPHQLRSRLLWELVHDHAFSCQATFKIPFSHHRSWILRSLTLLQVLSVSLRVPPSLNKSSLRPWALVQIDGVQLVFSNSFTMLTASMVPSCHLFCWRQTVWREASLFLYFLQTMRCRKSRNLLPDDNSLSATVAAHWNDDWTGKDFTFLFLSLVTIDALQEKTCTDKETRYLKIFFALSQSEKQQRAKLK